MQLKRYIPKTKKIPLWPHWGAENKIIVFLINEGQDQGCCHGNRISYILQLLSSFSLFQFEGSDVIIDKTMKSIEKKLIIVKNREGLNSTIYYDLMSEKNFLLND